MQTLVRSRKRRRGRRAGRSAVRRPAGPDPSTGTPPDRGTRRGGTPAPRPGRRSRGRRGAGRVRSGVGIAQPARAGRLLQLLIERVDYDGHDGMVSITFHASGIKALADPNSPETPHDHEHQVPDQGPFPLRPKRPQAPAKPATRRPRQSSPAACRASRGSWRWRSASTG